MQLSDEQCYKALLAMDTRFDGVFFAAVTSTGIYCRSICPAKKPQRSNCRFFEHAAMAERDGFRPCLRCRPELAPGNAPVDSQEPVVRGVLARIEAGALDHDEGMETLAEDFGLSARHLRRLVSNELGVSPIKFVQTRRLLLAKQLLTETRLSVTDVAFASGYSSVRRFNDAFRSHYRLCPTKLRQAARLEPPGEALRLRLTYRPPFAWTDLWTFLAARSIAGVEHVDENQYMRTVAIGNHRGWVRVEHDRSANALMVDLSPTLIPVLQTVLAKLRDLFDLRARPDVIDSDLSAGSRLAPLVRRRPGLRVPGAFDGFELAWRTVLGQQISVRGATTLAARFANTFGEPLSTPYPELRRTTPSAQSVARSTQKEIGKLGLPRARAVSLHALAQLALREPTRLDPGLCVAETCARLQALPGIGPWTTSYIAMRALRWPDAFPHGDLGVKKALGEKSETRVRRIAEAWRPWRAYAAMHLWMSRNSEA